MGTAPVLYGARGEIDDGGGGFLGRGEDVFGEAEGGLHDEGTGVGELGRLRSEAGVDFEIAGIEERSSIGLAGDVDLG